MVVDCLKLYNGYWGFELKTCISVKVYKVTFQKYDHSLAKNRVSITLSLARISTVHQLLYVLSTYKYFKDTSESNKLSDISFMLFFDKSLIEKIRYSNGKGK